LPVRAAGGDGEWEPCSSRRRAWVLGDPGQGSLFAAQGSLETPRKGLGGVHAYTWMVGAHTDSRSAARAWTGYRVGTGPEAQNSPTWASETVHADGKRFLLSWKRDDCGMDPYQVGIRPGSQARMQEYGKTGVHRFRVQYRWQEKNTYGRWIRPCERRTTRT
jgi:hypothetical protein